jgi:hypothetical protein
LIAAFSSSLLRSLGAGTTVAAMIWPTIARQLRSVSTASQRAKRWLLALACAHLLPQPPDRGGLKNPAITPQPDKPRERKPVLARESASLVQEQAEDLQHQDREHHHRIKQQPAAFAPITPPQRRTQRPAQHREIHPAAKRSSRSPAALSAAYRPDRSNKPG